MIKELQTCKICNQPVSELAHFWRVHQCKLENYCIQYFDKKDLLDGVPLPFKSVESYFISNFSNKNNLKKYLKNLPRDGAAEYCKNLLIRRKEQKELIYTPLQIELLSLPCFPPVHYLINLFDYYEFCVSIGLINKTRPVSDFSLNLIDPPSDSYIIIDSRESNPLKFGLDIIIDKLNVGDYQFSHNPYLVFERKSINDFIGTMSQGYDRFIKELERANDAGIYLIMIIENKIQDVLSFNYLPWMKRVKTKTTPEFIFHKLRELIQRFPRFQPLFVNGRRQVVEYIMKGSLSGDTFCHYDLQLLYWLDMI